MVRFDAKALYAALDAQRAARGLTWSQIANDTGVSATTIARTRDGGRMEVDGMLALVRWLGVPVETFTNEPLARAAHLTARPGHYLRVSDAARAIAFYVNAFGAREIVRLVEPGGRVAHAELRFGHDGAATIMLSDEYPEYGLRGPRAFGGSAVAMLMYVNDVDAACARAVDAGAQLVRPPEPDPFGDRTAKLLDPSGHEWILATRLETLTAGEMQARFAAMMNGAGDA